MKSFYWILGWAILLDWVIMPWLWGAIFYVKFALAILPFAFLFLPARQLNITFLILLVYLRSAGSYNLGIIFIALLIFAVFERWFLTNFFHKSSWQTLVLSAGGIVLFYGILAGLSGALIPGSYLDWQLVITAVSTAVFSIGFNFILTRTYKHAF